MFDNLESVVRRFYEIEDALASGELKSADLTRMTKERASIEELVVTYQKYKALQQSRDEAKAMFAEEDAEMRALAKVELDQVELEIVATEKHLIYLSLPKDPNDQKNVLLEIRAGTGGDEASLFCADLFRMYSHYADSQRWRTEILSSSEGNAGGFKEVIILVEGNAVFSRLKFESGVHRVQRVPATENQGRIHTDGEVQDGVEPQEPVDQDLGHALPDRQGPAFPHRGAAADR